MDWDVDYAPGIHDLVVELLQGLPVNAVRKVRWKIDLLRGFGLRLVETEHAERVDDDLCTLRSRSGHVQIRLFYFRSGPRHFTIVHAFKKKARALPAAEIRKAREAMTAEKEKRRS